MLSMKNSQRITMRDRILPRTIFNITFCYCNLKNFLDWILFSLGLHNIIFRQPGWWISVDYWILLTGISHGRFWRTRRLGYLSPHNLQWRVQLFLNTLKGSHPCTLWAITGTFSRIYLVSVFSLWREYFSLNSYKSKDN